MLLGLSLFGLNAIGAELEDPMGEETNDLPYEVFEGAVAGATKVCKLDQLPLGGHVQSSMPAVSPPPANEWFKAKPVIAALSPTKSPMQFANSSASMSPPLNLSELGPLSPASPGSLSAEQQQAHEQFGTVSSLAELDDST